MALKLKNEPIQEEVIDEKPELEVNDVETAQPSSTEIIVDSIQNDEQIIEPDQSKIGELITKEQEKEVRYKKKERERGLVLAFLQTNVKDLE